MRSLTNLLGDINETFWFPPKASSFAEETDSFFMAIMWISVVFFVLIVAAMVYFVMKFRRRPGYRGDSSALHSNTLEITWTVIPTIIVIWIFARGVYGYMDMMTPPAGDTIDINVTAQKWDWQFQYPNGAISDELFIPNERNIRLRMRSIDVLHAFYVPSFRAKSDVVPGRVTTMWFRPIMEGDFDLFCAEYCGDKHSEMIKKQGVHVLDMESYETKLAELAKPPSHPVYHGYWLYKNRGCKACHSLDGKKIVGPSFQGSWGETVQLSTGESIAFDDQYVQESIYKPQAKFRSGYEKASQMPSFEGQLSLEEVMSLTAFMKEMKNEAFIKLVSDEDGLTPEEAKSYGISDEAVAAKDEGSESGGKGDPANEMPAEPNK